jgi:hypothetical protein
MNYTSIFIFLAIALSGVLLWLLFARHKPAKSAGSTVDLNGENALPTMKHYLYFPQIRQALSAADCQYLLQSAPSHVAQQALRERREVVRRFLRGLHEDFANLARLGRIITALSPVISRKQEVERMILSLQFQMLYAMVWLRLSAGNLPLQQLEHLTGLVGRLATRMDQAMSEINALSAEQLSRRVNA